MNDNFKNYLTGELNTLRESGLYKSERIIASPQNARITLQDGREVLNFCAHNYLGLADHPALLAAAKESLDRRGLGLASVRFICGTQDLHKNLEGAISRFFGTEDTILYSSGFDGEIHLWEASPLGQIDLSHAE